MSLPEQATSLCHSCPKLCRYSCPVADADQDEATTPWGKMNTMRLVDQKRLPQTRETMALAYKCLNCRASEGACEMANPVSTTLDTYRAEAFRAGLAPEAVSSYCRKFQKESNPFQIDLGKELAKLPSPLPKKPKVVYCPGCTEIARSPKTITNTLELFKELKATEIGIYDEPLQCCGYPLFAAGDRDNFAEIAEIQSHALNRYPLIVSGAPACLYTMQSLYRSVGFPVRGKFMHVAEYLSTLPFKGKKKARPFKQRRVGHPKNRLTCEGAATRPPAS